MKIIYILETFPSISETFVLNEILELKRRGYDISVISINRPDVTVMHKGVEGVAKTLYLEDISVAWALLISATFSARHPLRALRFFRRARKLPSPYFWLAKWICAINREMMATPADIVHAHFIGPNARIAYLLSMLVATPFTVTAHRYDIFIRPLPDLRIILDDAKCCVTVSNYNKKYLSETFGILKNDIAVVPCGVDTRYFIPDAQSQRVPGRILSIGRLASEKGMHFLIEAATLLVARGVKFSIRIIGDGPLKSALNDEIVSNGLADHIQLMGAQSSDVVLSEMRSAEVFALASTSESLGVVYLEAMATETPVVGTNVLGVPEVIKDGHTGFLVPPSRPELLADRIQQLLGDPTLRDEFGKNGRAWVSERFTIEAQAEGLISVWSTDLSPGDTA